MKTDNLPERIKAARVKAGLSQSQAAREWDFELQSLQAWEQGRRSPIGLYRKQLEKVLSKIEAAKS